MPLVAYSSSSEDEENGLPTPRKRRCKEMPKPVNTGAADLPPLPLKFLDLYASSARVSTMDDPSLHGGRSRVTPHIEGNWPTHLYIEWFPSDAEHHVLARLVTKLMDAEAGKDAQIHSSLVSDLGTPMPLHISLSRTLGFSAERKDEFLEALEEHMKSSSLSPFSISLRGLDWVANYEKTRWFLVARVVEPKGNDLNKLLHLFNSVVQKYDQPPLYIEPEEQKAKSSTRQTRSRVKANVQPKPESSLDFSNIPNKSECFHFSIAWILAPPTDELLQATQALLNYKIRPVEELSIKVTNIKAKIGNVITSIALQKKKLIAEKDLF